MPGASFAKNSIVVDGFSLTRLPQLPVIRNIWELTVLHCIRVPFSCFMVQKFDWLFFEIALSCVFSITCDPNIARLFWEASLGYHCSQNLSHLINVFKARWDLNNWLMFSEQNFLFLYRICIQQQCDDRPGWPHLVKQSPTKSSCC